MLSSQSKGTTGIEFTDYIICINIRYTVSFWVRFSCFPRGK